MVLKIVAVIVILFLIYLIFFKKNREKDISKKKEINEVETLVQCATCETFISKDEAILSQEKYYCSKECLKKAK